MSAGAIRLPQVRADNARAYSSRCHSCGGCGPKRMPARSASSTPTSTGTCSLGPERRCCFSRRRSATARSRCSFTAVIFPFRLKSVFLRVCLNAEPLARRFCHEGPTVRRSPSRLRGQDDRRPVRIELATPAGAAIARNSAHLHQVCHIVHRRGRPERRCGLFLGSVRKSSVGSHGCPLHRQLTRPAGANRAPAPCCRGTRYAP